jgi:hypothetical protein
VVYDGSCVPIYIFAPALWFRGLSTIGTGFRSWILHLVVANALSVSVGELLAEVTRLAALEWGSISAAL